jgi:hypothetical protein
MRNRNNNSNQQHNRRSQNPMTRVYDSNGPDIKIRGTAAHIAEKYLQLARDSQSSGDPVAAENYYQHAEHYFRLIAAAQEQFRQNMPPQQQPRIDQDLRDDGDEGEESFSNFGAEPGYVAREPQPAYQPREAQPPYPPREQQQREHQPREHQSRDHQARDGNREQPYREPREHRPQPQPDADFERLPSFITGSAPQPGAPANGFEGNGHPGGGERFPPRRRRRPHGPRPEGRGAQAPTPQGEDFSSGD